MKTTINMTSNQRITVFPMPGRKITLLIEARDMFDGKWNDGAAFFLTPDQAGVLIFGLEQALEGVTA